GVASIINPFDENAIEAALVLKEKIAAKVTVISMGPPQVESALKEALARGVDDVILLSDRAFAGADTLATSYTLAEGIRTLEKPDLILFGKQAIDGDTAQVGPGVAELLGLPLITYVRKLEIDGDKVKVERVFEDGYEKMEAPLPVVLTVLKEMNEPRMASLKGKMKAKKAEIKMLNADAIKADPEKIGLKGSPTQVVKIFTPPKKTSGLKIEGTAPLEAARTVVAKLKEQKIV
ncbi:MAG: electron transfer flavoprotein subunit beta/FixA family protein, partial [Candidatus Margulisbacteria bacterium]|nr:electron transfer flavoprotein subunit beta/FixA family protein [Candidatus Margulisiibacteriota bacterium]